MDDECREAVPVVGSNGKLWWASVRYKDIIGFAIHENKNMALLYADLQTFNKHIDHQFIMVRNKSAKRMR
jgi:hypothetical protein